MCDDMFILMKFHVCLMFAASEDSDWSHWRGVVLPV